jgi:GT2 family glycosyltransferase
MKISVIIPTYKSPDALNLCLRSAVEGQQKPNQIIVVVDGYYDVNKDVLQKYKDYIDVLNLEQNVGLCRGTNLGVYNAANELILVVNDDNIFPKNWDVELLEQYCPGQVLSPNQIEPTPSMFKQFIIKDLGRDPVTFDLEKYWEFAQSVRDVKLDFTGGTLPFLISKTDYLKVGGWDESYPMGLTADWEFFYKCQLVGLSMVRAYNVNFYHFESLTTRRDPVTSSKRDMLQVQATEYFYYKWRKLIYNDPVTNRKYLK